MTDKDFPPFAPIEAYEDGHDRIDHDSFIPKDTSSDVGEYIRSSDGKSTPPVLANALTFLRTKYPSHFHFDDMRGDVMLVHPIERTPGFKPRVAQDNDASVLQEIMQRSIMPRMTKDTVLQAIAQRARECSFHPIRDYLDGLSWDGTERLPTFFTYYFGSENIPYYSEIGRMFLISMVARIYKPGCKVDYLPILEGKQGDEKSTACAALAAEWFSDQLPEVTNKEAAQHLRGKWLIEVAELDKFRKVEATALKAFVTRQVERYRPPYGRFEVEEARQCVFIGTTNEHEYLKDATGNRRFWPVQIGKIDISALKHDRDQLFAEAVHRFMKKEKWWPDREFEINHVVPQQDERYESDVWELAVTEFIKNEKKILITDILLHLGVTNDKSTQMAKNRVSGILKRNKWVQKRDGVKRWYYPPQLEF